jgi:hypothetical protein
VGALITAEIKAKYSMISSAIKQLLFSFKGENPSYYLQYRPILGCRIEETCSATHRKTSPFVRRFLLSAEKRH